MRAAYERGVRVFDLADLYGTHPFVMSALKKIPRQDFNLITKIWFRPGGLPEKERPDADVVIERFLKRSTRITSTSRCYIVSFEMAGGVAEANGDHAKLKQKGVLRAHGVSCHSIEALEAAAKNRGSIPCMPESILTVRRWTGPSGKLSRR
jgi:aryl-alcohol dehydrogenase-like predicted oxidoreductase